MKYIFIIIIFLFTFSCSKPKTVFICGDHICVNKAEAKQYFEENLTLEVKVLNDRDSEEPSLIELNLNQTNLKDKQVFVKKKIDNKKDIKDLTKKEKKKIISEVKRKQTKNKFASKKSLKKDKKISRSENKIKIKEKKIINKQQGVLDVCQIIKDCTIDEISKYLIKEGNNRNFPDITTRQ